MATIDEPRRFLADVRQRYLNDAEFHARVEMAVGIVRQGYVIEDEGLIAGIAAVGLAMADQPLGGDPRVTDQGAEARKGGGS